MSVIYFDNAAAAKEHPKIADSGEVYANCSSLHELGIISEQKVTAASKSLARLLAVNYNELIFTSGATESNNMAVKGVIAAKGGHVITSEIEHPSVIESVKYLEGLGLCSATYLKADKYGNILADDLTGAIRGDTVLVSLFYVNNETGTINDIEKFAAAVKAQSKKIIFHTDAAQAFGKIPLKLNNVDLMSVSAHKIHGPKGAGALYVRKGVKIVPLLHGGGQQGGLRAGTENIPGILGLCRAFELASEKLDENFNYVSALKARFLELCEEYEIKAHVNAEGTVSPYILNLSFEGVRGEILLNALSAEGIYVSTGSACHSRRSKQNIISKINPAFADSALRISFSVFNTTEEVEILAKAVRKNLQILRM
ncbi:MAG: cysteine desulfurase [Clostridiales bacterium]|jgi:cysteine desulfurase|nr:cysteine desulfurase [Clostridiales bacterium]